MKWAQLTCVDSTASHYWLTCTVVYEVNKTPDMLERPVDRNL